MSELNLSLLGFEKKFEDPFILPSSEFMPETLHEALDLALYLYNLNPMYREGIERAIDHFITNLKFVKGTSTKEDGDWLTYFREDLEFLTFLRTVGKEHACYGNAFVYIHYPFDRYLEDKNDPSKRFAIDAVLSAAKDVSFDLKSLTYTATFEGKKRTFTICDLPSSDKSRLTLRKIDPRWITIEPGVCSGKNSYIFRIPNTWVNYVEKRVLHAINDMPILYLKAIGQKKAFRFKSDEIFHMKDDTISGVTEGGWGIPDPILNYRMLHKLQVYHKIDESIARDFMMPFRVFSPAQGTEITTDFMAGPAWKREMQTLIANRRMDGEAIHAVPFPLEYNEHGANGKQLSPKDIIEYHSSEMLNALGVPAELYHANISYQHAPLAFRVFETNFMFYHKAFNKLLTWVAEKVRIFTKEDLGTIELEKPSAAADYERKSIMMSLYQAGQLSKKTLFEASQLGDPAEESALRMKEDMDMQLEAAKAQAEAERELQAETVGIVGLQQQAMAQAGGMGMAPMPAGAKPSAGGGITPTDIMEQADIKAQEWLSMPIGPRRTAMAQTKAADPNLYAMAKQKMEEMRGQVVSEARAQMTPQ